MTWCGQRTPTLTRTVIIFLLGISEIIKFHVKPTQMKSDGSSFFHRTIEQLLLSASPDWQRGISFFVRNSSDDVRENVPKVRRNVPKVRRNVPKVRRNQQISSDRPTANKFWPTVRVRSSKLIDSFLICSGKYSRLQQLAMEQKGRQEIEAMMNERWRVDGRTDGRTDGRDGRTDGQDGRTNGRKGRTDGRTGQTDGRWLYYAGVHGRFGRTYGHNTLWQTEVQSDWRRTSGR